MTPSDEREVWFLTGSQALYGEDTLRQVADQSRAICARLAAASGTPVRVVWKPVLTDADGIVSVMLAANADRACAGLIAWMHTFSPAKMWIAGLDLLRKPLLHLHTQADAELPWSTIDMDYMNLNQAAHGDREFGYVQARIGVVRKTVAGHVSDPLVAARIDAWTRAALGADALRHLRLARFGDNMRDVAVTEGDKVEAQLRFGVSVNTYGVNDLVAVVDAVSDAAVTALVEEYQGAYRLAPELAAGGGRHDSPALRRPDRTGPARLPLRRRLRRLHHQLRGPRRPAPATRPGRPAPDGRRLRFRRRGRLEDRRPAAHPEGGRHRAARRHLLHGGLHLPPGPRQRTDPRRPHVGGLPQHRGRPALVRDPPTGHRGPRGPGPAGLRRAARPGGRGRPGRHGRPLPPGRQRDRHRPARRAAAQAARWPARCGAPPPTCAPPPRRG